jgi:hypothetical protein
MMEEKPVSEVLVLEGESAQNATGTLPKGYQDAIDLAAIEAKMLEQPNQIKIPVNHHFGGGVYIRQIEIKAGTLIMGKRHRNETCNILLKGTLLVYVDESKPPVPMTGPIIFTTPPGTKKFAYCQEDAIFLNVIPTTATDPDEVEKLWIIPEDEYLALQEGKCLSLPQQ